MRDENRETFNESPFNIDEENSSISHNNNHNNVNDSNFTINGGLENIPQDNIRNRQDTQVNIEIDNQNIVTILPTKLERQGEFSKFSRSKDSKLNNFFDFIRQLIIVFLLAAIFFGFLFESRVNYDRKSAYLFRQGLCDKRENTKFTSKYAVVFDAGSTGSRVHVYEFQFCGDELLNLLDEVFEMTKPGLSTFHADPDGAVESLEPLLRKAWRRVPRDLRKCTPVVLKATAGLRLLPSEKVTNILNKVRMWLDDQPFHLPQSNSGFAAEPVSVIDGSEEAISAWISVNFLQGHIGPEIKNIIDRTELGTSVVLEMGGGSAQIVFDQNSTESSDFPGGIVDLNFFGRSFKLYQHSFLGFGLMEARKTIKIKFLDKHKNEKFPCYPTGYEEIFGENEQKLIGNSAGWSACYEIVKIGLFSDEIVCKKSPCSINGVHQPKIPSNAPIYALSFINDRVRNLGLDGAKGFTLNEVKQRAEKICSSNHEGEALYAKNPAICLDLVFIYQLLHEGYGIPENRQILSGQTINGYETGWTLGSALSVVEAAPTFCKV